jgi:hypothetical protein
VCVISASETIYEILLQVDVELCEIDGAYSTHTGI